MGWLLLVNSTACNQVPHLLLVDGSVVGPCNQVPHLLLVDGSVVGPCNQVPHLLLVVDGSVAEACNQVPHFDGSVTQLLCGLESFSRVFRCRSTTLSVLPWALTPGSHLPVAGQGVLVHQ